MLIVGVAKMVLIIWFVVGCCLLLMLLVAACCCLALGVVRVCVVVFVFILRVIMFLLSVAFVVNCADVLGTMVRLFGHPMGCLDVRLLV